METHCICFQVLLLLLSRVSQCPTLCDPIDGSPPGSSVPGILQARTLEWVASAFSNAWKWQVKVKSLSRVWLFVTPWTTAYQAPPSMRFSRQEYWSGLPVPSPCPVLSLLFFSLTVVGPSCGPCVFLVATHVGISCCNPWALWLCYTGLVAPWHV